MHYVEILLEPQSRTFIHWDWQGVVGFLTVMTLSGFKENMKILKIYKRKIISILHSRKIAKVRSIFRYVLTDSPIYKMSNTPLKSSKL